MFISINTIWISKMQHYDKFKHPDQFMEEYHKHINVLSNLINFYFREAFTLLNSKEIPVFTFLQD